MQSDPPRNPSNSGLGWPAWTGLAVVGAAAAILTFTTLAGLARACGIDGWLGWLLPLSVDAAGAVATWVWLAARVRPEAARFARVLAWSAVVCSISGNAAQHGMAALHIAPPWWVVVIVSAIPPTAFGAVVHLAVLVGRTVDQPEPEADQPVVDSTATDPEIVDDLRRWVVRLPGPPSRNAVMDRYGVGATRANRLVGELATAGGVDQ